MCPIAGQTPVCRTIPASHSSAGRPVTHESQVADRLITAVLVITALIDQLQQLTLSTFDPDSQLAWQPCQPYGFGAPITAGVIGWTVDMRQQQRDAARLGGRRQCYLCCDARAGGIFACVRRVL